MAIKLRKPPLNLALQAMHLKKHFLQGQVEIHRSCLRWRAVLQPTVFGRPYQVDMDYRLQFNPKVRILSPALELPTHKSEIHVFPDGTLCLYYPGEWLRTSILAETVVPWICEWLAHYEVWQVTRTWHGGGVHLDKNTIMPDAA